MKQKTLTTRQKQCKKINRKRGMRKWWHTMSRRVGIMSLAASGLLALGGGWWFWHSGRLSADLAAVTDRFWQETASLGLRVDRHKITLEGRNFTPLADVNRAIGVRGGEPIMALPLADIRARLEAIPRVREAEIARILPDQLHVRLIEREPVAVWQNEGRLQLIDRDGMVMEYIDPAQYKHLPLVVGDGAPSHAAELLAMLATEPDLDAQVQSAIRVGERRWNVRFKNGIELKLPEEKPQDAWQNFARMEQEHHMLARAITTVDMRLSDRIFIKPVPEENKPEKPAAHTAG